MDKLIHEIKKLDLNKPIILAIDGFGGSGKSTLAKKIKEIIPNTHIITLDDFRTHEVYEVQRERLLNEVIIPIKENKTIRYQKWLWSKEEFSDYVELQPKGLIIIEGTTALHDELRDFYDFKIWIDIPQEVAFQRGLERDKNEYGVDSTTDWLNKWIPYEKDYLENHKPKDIADFIYDEPK